MQVMVTQAVASIEKANKTAEGYANRSRRNFKFGLGDGVLLSTKYFIPEAFRDRKRKLAAKFAGHYEKIEVISPVAYRLRLPIGTKDHDVFHSSMLKPYHGDAKTERTTLPRYLSSCETEKKSSRWRAWSATVGTAVSRST
jgi:hypothetical protein